MFLTLDFVQISVRETQIHLFMAFFKIWPANDNSMWKLVFVNFISVQRLKY